MPSGRSEESPSSDLDDLKADTERRLLAVLGPDYRSEMQTRAEQDHARWQYEHDSRQAAIAAERERMERDRSERPPPTVDLAVEQGQVVTNLRIHDDPFDDDLEAQRPPPNDPANSRSLHPSWWIQNFDRYEPRLPPMEPVYYDTRGEVYPLFQHNTIRPDFIPMSPGEDSDAETVRGPVTAALFGTPDAVGGMGQDWPPQEDEAARRARLRAENWHHFKQRFTSFGSAFRFIGRMLLRILFGIVWSW